MEVSKEEINHVTQWNGMIVGAAMLIIIALCTWGATELVNIKTSLQQVNSELAALNNITELKLKVQAQESATAIASLISRVDRLEKNDSQMWPRLRALSTNDSILAGEIEKLHPGNKVQLKSPEAY